MNDFPQPLNLTTLVYVAVASFLGYVGHWLKERKRQPHELRKLDAETRQIHTTAEISPVGITLETLREIQTVIRKAEDRRAEWHAKEEEMRTQILFWRNKAEELDGQLADVQETVWRIEAENTAYEEQIKKMSATLTLKDTNYDNTKHLPIGPLDHPQE